jgi:hypothetical protein
VALAPPLRVLRYPSKAMVLVSLAWAVLAGLGFERWSRPDPAPRGWAAVLGPVLALGALAGAAAALFRFWPDVFAAALVPESWISASWREVLAPAACRLALAATLSAAVVVVGLVRMRRPGRAGPLAGLAAVLVVLDLALAGTSVNPTAPAEFYRLRPPVLGSLHQDDLSRLFVYRYPFSAASEDPAAAALDPYRIARHPAGFSKDAARTLAARLYMVPPVEGCWGVFGSYEPDLIGLYPAHLAELVRWMAEAEGSPAHARFLRIGAVRHVSSLLRHAGFEDFVAVALYPSLLAQPILFFEVPGAVPRTYVVGTARPAEGETARQLLLDPRFDLRREVVVSGPAVEAGPGFSGHSRIVDFRPDLVRIEADLSAPGVVVLVDTYDPGWRVTVDGRPAPLLRANVAFRGVNVPAGKHVIEQVYRPWTVVYGLGTSALAALAGLGVVLGRFARPSERQP